MEADPQDPSPRYYLGRHYESDQRDTVKAEECFREALRRNPLHTFSLYHLGYLNETRGEWEAAAKYYRDSADLAGRENRPYGLPWLGLARVEQRTGSADEAVRLARHGAALTPRDPEAQRVLAKTSSGLGLEAETIQAWKQVAELDTTDPAPHYQLYRLHLKLGQTRQAQDALARFNELQRLYGDQ